MDFQVSGNADKHLPGFVQKSVSFLQLSARAQNPAQRRVAKSARDLVKSRSVPVLFLSAFQV